MFSQIPSTLDKSSQTPSEELLAKNYLRTVAVFPCCRLLPFGVLQDFMIQAGAIPLLEKMMLDEYDLIRARPLLALLRATLDEASAGTQRAI